MNINLVQKIENVSKYSKLVSPHDFFSSKIVSVITREFHCNANSLISKTVYY